MDWSLKRDLERQLGMEQGYCRYPAGIRERFALVYPNSYRVGMSNLGIHILYRMLNERRDIACERFFLPERRSLERYRSTATPLMSLESQLPLFQFPIIGFAISFEMDYFHVLDILSLGHVKLLAAERGEQEPLVIGGGPCATFNPEPLHLFFDAFVIGEGEEVLPAFLEAYFSARAEGLPKEQLLQRIGQVPGIYVPSLYRHVYATNGILSEIRPLGDAPNRVARQWVKHLDAYPAGTAIVTKDAEFDLYLMETARGCGRHCRFCMAGYCFRRPRNRSLSALQKELEKARSCGKRIGLMGAAISDYPWINELCGDILEAGLSMSVASFRADSVTRELVEALAASGLKTLTLAPEAGSARMRAVINKGIEERHLFQAMEWGLAAGIRNYRLYFMIGLPYETEEDIAAIPELALRVRERMDQQGGKGTLTLSIHPFVPKPFTPFQWLPMAERRRMDSAIKGIRKALAGRKRIVVLSDSPREAQIQGVLARGDRRISPVLLAAHAQGGASSFLRALRMEGLEADQYLLREYAEDEIFPWEILDMGIRKDYLHQELKRARQQEFTPQCFDGCRRCGVCTCD